MSKSRRFDQRQNFKSSSEIPEIKTVHIPEKYETAIGYAKTDRGLNLREQPDLMSKSLKILKDKEELLIEGEDDGWYKVVTGSGLEGYCLKELEKIQCATLLIMNWSSGLTPLSQLFINLVWSKQKVLRLQVFLKSGEIWKSRIRIF